MNTEKSNPLDGGPDKTDAKGMNNCLRALKAMRPQAELLSLTADEFEGRFRNYDQTILAIHHHHLKLRNGIEITCIVVHFPEILSLQTRRSMPPKQMSSTELLESRKASKEWFDKIYATEKQRASFDCDRANWMANERGDFLLFLPEKSK